MFFIHWRPQGTKIFTMNKFQTKISNGEFFPNCGILLILYMLKRLREKIFTALQGFTNHECLTTEKNFPAL